MSVTFWAPDAPTTKVTPYDDAPDFVVEESVLPELNLSNSNASAFLKLLGLPNEECGTIEPEQFPALRQRLLELQNDEAARAPALRPMEEAKQRVTPERREDGVTVLRVGARVIDCGLQDHQVTRYAQVMGELLAQAQQHGYEVSWG